MSVLNAFDDIYNYGLWRPLSLNELTTILFHMELTHLGLKAFLMKLDGISLVFYTEK